jgi:hypothetical protein
MFFPSAKKESQRGWSARWYVLITWVAVSPKHMGYRFEFAWEEVRAGEG